MSGFPLPTRIVKSSALSQYNLIFTLFPLPKCLSLFPLPGDPYSEIRTYPCLHRHVASLHSFPHVPR